MFSRHGYTFSNSRPEYQQVYVDRTVNNYNFDFAKSNDYTNIYRRILADGKRWYRQAGMYSGYCLYQHGFGEPATNCYSAYFVCNEPHMCRCYDDINGNQHGSSGYAHLYLVWTGYNYYYWFVQYFAIVQSYSECYRSLFGNSSICKCLSYERDRLHWFLHS